MSDSDESSLKSLASEDTIHEFLQTFAFDVDGGLVQEKVDKMWDPLMYLSGCALFGRYCLNAYSMFGKLLMPQGKVDSLVDITIMSYMEMAFWIFGSVMLVLCPPNIRCTWVAFRNSFRFAAGFSCLRGLALMNTPICLAACQLSLSTPALGAAPASIRALCAVLGLIIFIPLGIACLMLKMEQIRFATDDTHTTLGAWTLSDIFKLLMFANQIVSLIDLDQFKINDVLTFAFGRENAEMDSGERNVKNAYESRLVKLIWSSSKYNAIQKLVFTFTYNAATIQKLLIKTTAGDGADDV